MTVTPRYEHPWFTDMFTLITIRQSIIRPIFTFHCIPHFRQVSSRASHFCKSSTLLPPFNVPMFTVYHVRYFVINKGEFLLILELSFYRQCF